MMVMEMSRNLRQLVDNCFEEAQFDAAIDTLDLLRSPDHVPSPIHLLHLLFISLHPTTHSVNLDNPDEQPLNHAALLQQSPRKIVKQSKAHQLLLTPTAVQAASRALHAFLRTNGPTAFTNALPFYPLSKSTSSTVAPSFNSLEFVDSPIYTNVLAIQSARSVWEILKQGFTARAAKAIPPPALAKARQKLGRDASFTDSTLSLDQSDDLKPVGEHSWLALDFLVSLFEADAQQTSSPKHSILLLKQLPPPPFGSQTRWDASEPLKVAFYALSQEDDRKQRTGLRLLLLLIDLTRTIYLNHPAFASAVVAQLSSFTPPSSFISSPSSTTTTTANANTTPPPSTPPSKKKRKTNLPSPNHSLERDQDRPRPQALSYLFTLLPSDTPARKIFRMTLCRKLLAGLSDHEDDGMGVSLDAANRDRVVDVDVEKSGNGVGTRAKASTSAKAPSTPTTASSVLGNANTNANGIAKPRPRPRPILKKRKEPEPEGEREVGGNQTQTQEGGAPPVKDVPTHVPTPGKEENQKDDKGKGKGKTDAESHSVPASASAPTSTPARNTESATAIASAPPPPAPIQNVPIPSLGELARVLQLGLGLGVGVGKAGGKARATRDNDEEEEDEEDNGMMRVRFELVMAWVSLKKNEEEKEKEEREKEELGKLFDGIFGPLGEVGTDMGVDAEGEAGQGRKRKRERERTLHRRVLNAFVGV